MVQIKDYYGGHEKTFGPYTVARFICINQSFPVSASNPTVTYSVITPNEELDTITVSLIHNIESADE